MRGVVETVRERSDSPNDSNLIPPEASVRTGIGISLAHLSLVLPASSLEAVECWRKWFQSLAPLEETRQACFLVTFASAKAHPVSRKFSYAGCDAWKCWKMNSKFNTKGGAFVKSKRWKIYSDSALRNSLDLTRSAPVRIYLPSKL